MPLDSPLMSALSLPRLRGGGRRISEELMYGIELEYENFEDIGLAPTHWTTTGDGSLRNGGIEFVSRVLGREQVPTALTNIENYLAQYNPDPHPRCGIHVHLNMRPRTIGEMFSFMASYVLLEPSIFQHFCPDRVNSSFCVPVYLNDLMLMRAHQSMQLARSGHPSPLRALVGTSKYSALNAASLGRFGTLEFRQLPSTLDFERIRNWVEVLTALYDGATSFGDPLEVVSLYEGIGLRGFQRRMLGYTQAVSDPEQHRAVTGATIISGYEEQNWNEMDWPTLQEAV